MTQRGSAATEDLSAKHAKERQKKQLTSDLILTSECLASFGVFGGSICCKKIFAERDEFCL
jgi:hypothetical protein